MTLAKAIPPEEHSAWLNVGVAGHRHYDIGTVVLARQVTDAETSTVYRLSPPASLHLEMGEVRTVAHVETRYETPALYEMEAAAFCERAFDLTSSELIQVLKIVQTIAAPAPSAFRLDRSRVWSKKACPKSIF